MFSDIFGKAAVAITSRLLASDKLFDVTPYFTRTKAPMEKIQAVVDREKSVE